MAKKKAARRRPLKKIAKNVKTRVKARRAPEKAPRYRDV